MRSHTLGGGDLLTIQLNPNRIGRCAAADDVEFCSADCGGVSGVAPQQNTGSRAAARDGEILRLGIEGGIFQPDAAARTVIGCPHQCQACRSGDVRVGVDQNAMPVW
jgi:hypothetical protein